MKYLPIFLDIQNCDCLVVGAGPVAARKTRMICTAGGNVRVVAPEVSEQMQSLLSEPIPKDQVTEEQAAEELGADELGANKANADKQAPRIALQQRAFQESDLQGANLVIAASNNAELNKSISKAAAVANIPCNVADQPSAGSFILPSVVNRDPIQIAISSGATSPILARILKARIEAFVPKAYSDLAKLSGKYRDAVKNAFKTLSARKYFWEQTLNGKVAELILAGKPAEAESTLLASIQQEQDQQDQQEQQLQRLENNKIVSSDKAPRPPAQAQTGEVYLVGAGPGDPDLLTFRALRLIQQADVVLYDRLVAEPIMQLCREDAEKIYVGKKRADHAMQQHDINQTLLEQAQAGKRVLRLKGGDPFIFGRGGEEIETLAENGISFQVVPGITAAAGCASYAGIPLTHRDHAQSCVFITGHLKKGTLTLDWPKLVHETQTLVCYMGLVGLPVLCDKLIEHGMRADMPAALIERGTTQQQKVYTGTVDTLADIVTNNDVVAPTLIIIGSVVTLRDKLSWFNPSVA